MHNRLARLLPLCQQRRRSFLKVSFLPHPCFLGHIHYGVCMYDRLYIMFSCIIQCIMYLYSIYYSIYRRLSCLWIALHACVILELVLTVVTCILTLLFCNIKRPCRPCLECLFLLHVMKVLNRSCLLLSRSPTCHHNCQGESKAPSLLLKWQPHSLLTRGHPCWCLMKQTRHQAALYVPCLSVEYLSLCVGCGGGWRTARIPCTCHASSAGPCLSKFAFTILLRQRVDADIQCMSYAIAPVMQLGLMQTMCCLCALQPCISSVSPCVKCLLMTCVLAFELQC